MVGDVTSLGSPSQLALIHCRFMYFYVRCWSLSVFHGFLILMLEPARVPWFPLYLNVPWFLLPSY